MIAEYFLSLLQPWRRVTRAEFVVALTVFSLPGLVFWGLGMAQVGSGLLAPLQDFQRQVQIVQQATPHNLEQVLTDLHSPTTATQPAPAPTVQTPADILESTPLDFAAIINGLVLLLFTPYVRGRLLDMGYALRTAGIGALVLQASVLHETLSALTGHALLPFAWVLAGVTMVGYLWLSIRGSKARRAAYERIDGYKRADPDDFPKF